MAAGVLMLLVGIGVLSRLFRHDLAGRVATMNLTGGAVGSASAGTTSASASTAPIQGPPAPGAPAVGGKGGISAPLAARGKIIGTPGAGTHNGAPPFDNWQSSNAIDIGVPVGTAVLAPENGTVVRVTGSWAGGAGRTDGYGVTIQGADGNQWYLKHLSRSSVRAGQAVVAGQVIGASGAGNSSPHLHLGQLRGNPLDTFGYR